MVITNFLALLWGFSLIIVCFAFLVRPKHLSTLWTVAENQGTLLFLGMLTVFLGVANVLSYNVWSKNWEVIITILGWLLIIKGMALLYMPENMIMAIEKFKKNSASWMPIALVAGVILGCLLIYFGLSF